MPQMFPIFLDLSGRLAVVVGGGPVAGSKLAPLQSAGARILVVAPEVCPAIEAAGVVVERRPFRPSDLDDAWLAIAAATPEVNRDVAIAAAARRIFVNAVDDPRHASAYLGGVLRRQGVTVAISTDGTAPALAGLLREGLDALLPPTLAEWSRLGGELRRGWKADGVPMDQRRGLLLDALNRLHARPAQCRCSAEPLGRAGAAP